MRTNNNKTQNKEDQLPRIQTPTSPNNANWWERQRVEDQNFKKRSHDTHTHKHTASRLEPEEYYITYIPILIDVCGFVHVYDELNKKKAM